MENSTVIWLSIIVLTLTLDFVHPKPKKKFGCLRPIEPIYGKLEFNRALKSLRIVCEEGFDVIGHEDWYCTRGKWMNDYSLAPEKKLDFKDKCFTLFSSIRECPPLQAPRNGKLFTSSREAGGKATFRCNEGYIIDGSDERFCHQESYIWGGEQPVCRRLKTVGDMADLIEDKMISKLSSVTATSEDGIESKLAVGKSGLDIVFALDVSASIGDKSLKIAKDFIKLLVKTFGISSDPTGGKNGTRVAFVTFSSKADIIFNLDDKSVRTQEAAFKKIVSITGTQGGTRFSSLMGTIYRGIYEVSIANDEDRNKAATRAIFIITDAEATSRNRNGSKTELGRVKTYTDMFKEYGFEIFTIGVGHTNRFKLSLIASKPYTTHVFIINEMADLKRMAEIISEKNLDYGQCGISGNTEIAEDSGDARADAWPWIGWVNVYDRNSPRTCGGYLVCQRYFVTPATCVIYKQEDGNLTVVDKNKILVTLGDKELYKPDAVEVQVRVSDIHIHPNYTGVSNEYNVKEYDIALLDFGQEKDKLPVLNKHVRPICMASEIGSDVYAFSKTRRMHLQKNWQNSLKKGYVAGWGHKIEQSFDLPIGTLTQLRRTVQMNGKCKKVFPNLDTKKFFCVRNDQESKMCRNSDIGGPYMDEMNENKQYSVLGMTLNTKNCDKFLGFSIFLDTLEENIVSWLGGFLSECNRMEEIVPTTPPPTTPAKSEKAKKRDKKDKKDKKWKKKNKKGKGHRTKTRKNRKQ